MMSHPIMLAVLALVLFTVIAVIIGIIHTRNEHARAVSRWAEMDDEDRAFRSVGWSQPRPERMPEFGYGPVSSRSPTHARARADGDTYERIQLESYDEFRARRAEEIRRGSGKAYLSSRGEDVKRTSLDDGFDAGGFAVGLATGMPISPSRGFSAEAMLGASMHSSSSPAAPARDPGPSSSSCDISSSSSSSSSDSGSSSSSCDSGGGL